MEITNVEIRKTLKEGSRMIGKAEVTLDGCFVVKDIRILKFDEGLKIAMPSKEYFVDGEKKHKDLAHPINQETRDMFSNAILEAYENYKEEE